MCLWGRRGARPSQGMASRVAPHTRVLPARVCLRADDSGSDSVVWEAGLGGRGSVVYKGILVLRGLQGARKGDSGGEWEGLRAKHYATERRLGPGTQGNRELEGQPADSMIPPFTTARAFNGDAVAAEARC